MRSAFKGIFHLLKRVIHQLSGQVGYFYYDGLGVEKNAEKAFYWTKRAAEHGDRDGQFNLACFYEEGIGTGIDMEAAKMWYGKAAKQNHDLAIKKCHELKIDIV